MVFFIPIPQVSSFNTRSRFGETQMTSGHMKRAAVFLVLWGGSGVVAMGSQPGPCLEELSSNSWHELERLYRQAEPGHIPNGFARGRLVYCSDAPLVGIKSGAAQFLWKGKHFCAAEQTLINQWCGVRAIRATVCRGTSWIDGKPSIIMDYNSTSRVWSDVRDEMREISPGLYVGATYRGSCSDPRLILFFILRICPAD